MKAFVAVVDNGSFVRAAEMLNTSKAAILRQVADLGQRLGIRLLNRTTRKLSMTARASCSICAAQTRLARWKKPSPS